MLVSLVPAPLHDFPCMGFVLLLGSVGEKSHVVVHVEIEQWSRFSTSFVDDEVVECIMLKMVSQSANQG